MRRLFLLFVLALVATPLCAQRQVLSNQQHIQKLNSCYRYLERDYVDEIYLDKCVEEAIRATLKELDPHSTYLTKEEMDMTMGALNGGFSGIGISYMMLGDTIVVRRVNGDSPAQRAGVELNDRIVTIDGRPVGEYSDITSALRGHKGSKVKVGILHTRTLEHSDITITRNDIEVSSIEANHIIAPNIGYIKIASFSRNTAQEFSAAVKRLGKLDAIIIDLRSNSGGMLTSAIGLSELFLDKNDIIVSTEGRNESFEYAARRRGELCKLPVIVLINEESASASEIFAGAIQDHDRGVVIGNTSFGKGLVQRQITFDDGSAMRITTARYKTPSGRIIQRPYNQGEGDKYYGDHTRYNHPDSMRLDTLPKYTTLKSGRTVYGGGGIIPDIYITHDTTSMPKHIIHAIQNSAFQRSMVELWDSTSPEKIRKSYPTIEAYDANYEVDSVAINAFCRVVNDNSAKEDTRYTLPLLKAYIAEDLYGSGSYEYIYNRAHDKVLLRAIEVAQDKERMETILGATP